MLEEQLARDLLNKGANISIWNLKASKKFNFKGSLGPFKADFSDIEDKDKLMDAICEGEGNELEGKDALKLLKKIHEAKISGVIDSYSLIFNIEPHGNCGNLPLLFTNEGLRVFYSQSHWENELKLLCEKPCQYQNMCPSYQAQKAGKEIIYS